MAVKISNIMQIATPEVIVCIDASTKSMAFCVYGGGRVLKYGKITFGGRTISEKIQDIAMKSKAFFEALPDDSVLVIEDTIYTNSPNTAAQLSKTQGALLAGAFLAGVEKVYAVSPIAWQSFIGTRLLSASEKDELRRQYPQKSAAWYKAKERDIRKHLTIDTVNKTFGINVSDDDIADSCGIAIYASQNWGKLINSKVNKV